MTAVPAQVDVEVSEIPKMDHVPEQSFTNGHNGIHSSSNSIPLNTDYAYKLRKMYVLTIGAGFSGPLMAHKFQHRFPEPQEFGEHTIYEACNDVGAHS
ncbi:uncharacterized protein N7479_011238 [Penicillium vulpinum]|uniref:uncharacterized protein n=1 Tax=Penicillium vulpinum TaxID=29845 RepID=UPI0025493F1E|nr:uncharacterized protein N7479_011238 [Penicillium vulpinum]KAJ5952825.1 hypothetical protein N7479_011238 [Penicillium vulpinum]